MLGSYFECRAVKPRIGLLLEAIRFGDGEDIIIIRRGHEPTCRIVWDDMTQWLDFFLKKVGSYIFCEDIREFGTILCGDYSSTRAFPIDVNIFMVWYGIREGNTPSFQFSIIITEVPNVPKCIIPKEG